MEKLIEDMKKHTDCLPWYWISYGEKCYGFGVVAAFPLKENDEYPPPGTKLHYNEGGNWEGENGVEMMVDSWVTMIDEQNGDTICCFIASAHAFHMGSVLREV